MILNAELLNHFLGVSALDEVGEDQISDLMEQYPYFVHLHWLSAIKAWNSTHNQDDLQVAGAYTFNPLRLKQYCSEPLVQKVNNPVENNTLQEESKEAPTESLPSAETKEEIQSQSEQHEASSESVIQPLFTQDYFAYTGAKLPEKIENDKKPTMDQLRSFTGWLRTMKRSVTYSVDPDSDGDKSIQDSSENAHPEQDAITETMAEVRASMGHYDKAIAIYEKLSLSNPEKSAYFAQKIEALKNK
ncbi:MAG: hypothetical protein ACRDE2_12585 [Chitinophagaceae bacterium]